MDKGLPLPPTPLPHPSGVLPSPTEKPVTPPPQPPPPEPHLTSPNVAFPPRWLRDPADGGNGTFWWTKMLRWNLEQAEIWRVGLCVASMLVCACVFVHVWLKRGKGPGQCVMLGLLHLKLICLYFIPHFSSDEPAPQERVTQFHNTVRLSVSL